jgi:acyl-CoA dehydrogenase
MQERPPAFSAPRDWIDWPFFDVSHREFATRLDCFVDSTAVRDINHDAVDEACRKLVRALGEAGLLEVAVPSPDGDASGIDSRTVCLARETLARRDGLADFALAMQGWAPAQLRSPGQLSCVRPFCRKRGRVSG